MMSNIQQSIEELDAVLHWRGKHAQAIRERDALQQLLNAKDEREDALGSLVSEAELALKALNVAVSVFDVELSDSARRGLRLIIAALKPAESLQCQFPQSCPSNCGCDIPDFTPGNGNRARRRAESLGRDNSSSTYCLRRLRQRHRLNSKSRQEYIRTTPAKPVTPPPNKLYEKRRDVIPEKSLGHMKINCAIYVFQVLAN